MIRPEDLAELATTLAQGANEVHWRTAIGRAYFAAFHRARELFRDLGFEPPKGDQSHAFLWRRLQNCGHTKLREVPHRTGRHNG